MNLKSTSLRVRVTASALLLAGVAGLTLGAVGVASAATPSTSSSAAPAAAAAGPVTVINSVTDPTGAAAAFKQFDTATGKTFTPTSDPTFADTGWAVPVGTGAQENDAPAGSKTTPKILSITNTLSSGWSVGGSVGVEAGAGVIGFANASVSLKLSASHNWENTESDTETITANVEPGQMVWILESHSQATYTGTYTFTAADGTHYQVTNVTITKPASRDGNPLTAASYRLVQAPIHHGTTTTATGRPSTATLTALSRQLGYIK